MSATWLTVTAADLDDYLVAAKVDAAQSSALGATQGDPFDDVMPDVIAMVRMMIASCQRNRLSSTANSVPPSLFTHTCWLILEAMVLRLEIEFKDDIRTKIRDAKQYLEKVASCDYAIETPTNPEDPGIEGGGDVEIVTKETRLLTRDTLKGL